MHPSLAPPAVNFSGKPYGTGMQRWRPPVPRQLEDLTDNDWQRRWHARAHRIERLRSTLGFYWVAAHKPGELPPPPPWRVYTSSKAWDKDRQILKHV